MVDRVIGANGNMATAAEWMEQEVRRRLSASPTNAFMFEKIAIRYENGVLTLRGSLPSFYLKQVLQTLLRDVEGVDRVRNQVDVKTPRWHRVEMGSRGTPRF